MKREVRRRPRLACFQTPSPRSSSLTIERHNNPGALRVPGSTAFQRFSSPQEGVHAQESLLTRYFQQGRNTVRSVVEKYAPRKGVGGDNTDEQVNNYIAYVAKRIGVHPDQPVANVSQLARAMREFETGKRGF